MRQFLEVALPLLLPTALYLLFMITANRRGASAPGQPFWWREVPWLWLATAGAALDRAALMEEDDDGLDATLLDVVQRGV